MTGVAEPEGRQGTVSVIDEIIVGVTNKSRMKSVNWTVVFFFLFFCDLLHL